MSRETELTELAVEDHLGAYLDLNKGLCDQLWFEYGASVSNDGAVGVISPD